MRDFVGNLIEVGDKVVYSRTVGSKLDMVEVAVLGFTDTRVKVTPIGIGDHKRGYALCNPIKLVIYEKAGGYLR